jgi:hypothetical protein
MKLKGQGRKLSLTIAQNLQKLYLYLSDARRGAISMCLLHVQYLYKSTCFPALYEIVKLIWRIFIVQENLPWFNPEDVQ